MTDPSLYEGTQQKWQLQQNNFDNQIWFCELWCFQQGDLNISIQIMSIRGPLRHKRIQMKVQNLMI